ncbi:taste receptor type 2 member 14-like [Ochotona princeps]|uniref:taste receptor type 2 member 14-like n=1 Tax=Ochotona princeps TaxID=9978 RepID=UPI0027147D68|nr:taste receptor type 2 member 14-like [Ochotona princeps]
MGAVAVTQSILTVISAVERIIGIFSNGFIVLVNFIDWVKRRKVSSVDQILTALAISRTGLLLLETLYQLICVISPNWIATHRMLRMITVSWAVTNHFNIWFATSLSIFYFFKIVNFSNSTFLYLKLRVEKVVSKTLLFSLVLLFVHVAILNTQVNAYIGGCERNMTCRCNSNESLYLSRLFLLTYLMSTIIPFTVSLITFLLLIHSLCRHLRKMHLSGMMSKDTNTKAHLESLKIMVAFLLFYVVFFLSVVIQVWAVELLEKRLIAVALQILELTFSSGHSCILILGNKKLKQTLLVVLGWLRYRLEDAKP